MTDEMVIYIAKTVANITRQYPFSSLTIGVIMPTTATELYPTFAVKETLLNSAMDGEPLTSVFII